MHALSVLRFIPSALHCLYLCPFRHRRHWRGRPRPMDTVLLAVSIVLFVITAHWALRFVVLLEQFTEPSNVYLSRLHGHIVDLREAAGDALCMAEIVVADLTMVYRVYFVWGRSKRVVIAPLITASLSIVFAIVIVVNEVQSTNLAVYIRNDTRWITTLSSLELVTNIMITVLAYRIWSIEQGVKSVCHTSIMPVITLLVESAAIFTIFLILIPASVLTQSPDLTGLALDLAGPGIGITLSLIIVRVGIGEAVEDRVSSAQINGDDNFPGQLKYVVPFGEGCQRCRRW